MLPLRLCRLGGRRNRGGRRGGRTADWLISAASRRCISALVRACVASAEEAAAKAERVLHPADDDESRTQRSGGCSDTSRPRGRRRLDGDSAFQNIGTKPPVVCEGCHFSAAAIAHPLVHTPPRPGLHEAPMPSLALSLSLLLPALISSLQMACVYHLISSLLLTCPASSSSAQNFLRLRVLLLLGHLTLRL